MKGASWRFVIAMLVLGLGIYYFVIRPEEKPAEKPPVTETKIWPDKVDAIAGMKTTMYAVVEAEKRIKGTGGDYIACDPNPAEVPDMRVPWDKNATGWKDLDVMMPRETWFQYEVVVTGPDTFEVHARTLAEGSPLEFVIDQDMNFW